VFADRYRLVKPQCDSCASSIGGNDCGADDSVHRISFEALRYEEDDVARRCKTTAAPL